MKKTKITAALLAALTLSACASVEEFPDETDALPADGNNIISSEATAAPETTETTSDSVSETTEAAETTLTSEEPEKPAETWTDPEEPPIEPPAQTEEEATYSEEITAIDLTYYEITLETGERSMPIVTMYPEDASDKSELWSSSDESVAVVDDIGNITALSEGECVIKVQSAISPDVYAEVLVTVAAAPETEDTENLESSNSNTQLTCINGILIANKTYSLPADYNPGIDPDAQAAFDKMQSAAAAEGLNIYISSGFRSYDYQAELYERYVEKSGKAEADRYSARPGHSEHQTGLAFDLNTIDITFADTAEYDWLKVHCAEYGFIIRYPENGESITGYMYEPWHIRYLGTETAQKVYDSGLTLEEYLGIDSKYSE